MHKHRSRIVSLAAPLVLLAALAACNSAPEVLTTAVTRQDFRAWVTSNGKVEPIAPHTLRALVAALVERVHAVEGQAVRRGHLLVELDGAEASAQLAAAREALLAAEERLRAARAGGPPQELARLEADLRKTGAELERLRGQVAALERLVEKQAATEDELARTRLELERAEAEFRRLNRQKDELARTAALEEERAQLDILRARSEVRVWQDKVRSTRITAPADGTLYALPVRPGDFVRPGDLLAALADLSRVQVRVFVDEPELGPLEAGQKVEISWDAMPANIWWGRVEHLPKQVVARGARSVGEVLCSVESPARDLLPNTNVNVRVLVRERPGALVLARAAVRGEGNERFVFLVADGHLRRQPVRLGAASVEQFEVLEGLNEGDLVALPSDRPLSDGMAVRAREVVRAAGAAP